MFVFLSLATRPYYDCKYNDTTGYPTECEEKEWDVQNPTIPCQYLSRLYIDCTSTGLDKFSHDLPFATLPSDGCDGQYNNINRFGIGVCWPLETIECIGMRYWVTNNWRCFKDEGKSSITALFVSLFFGLVGADRFYLGYPLLGLIKLLTLGGFGIWWLIDLILLAVGQINPHLTNYKHSY